ncbi:hypothetical protein GWK47_050071 [Chionoecetes opilio]|uniref:Uncharacterized protein n=1 Tax=Chionoecetes opilio TaxID=41210 RepID=A0A8J5CEL9_CHIOP|nr:hypothetical protein GWK47_050071 [Chionoecetes opilio]
MWREGRGGVGVKPSRSTSEGVGATTQHISTADKLFSSPDKSQFDSHNDSGFLSGSNLLSCSSLGPDDTEAMRLSEPQTPECHKIGGALTPSRLDSGIDISDQLSSLHLASSSTTSTSTSTSEVEGYDAPQRRTISPPPRRSRLGLSDTQVALLQEIFKRDEDGDT